MNEQENTSSAVAAYLGQTQPDPAQAARASVTLAAGTDADFEAELRRVAQKIGVPVDTARAFPEEIKREAQVGSIDFGDLANRYPSTARFLAGEDNAKIAHDDVDNLGLLEQTLGFFKNTGNAAVSGLQRASAGVVGAAQAPFDLAAPLIDPLVGTVLPGNPLRVTAEGLSRFRQSIDVTAKANMPKSEGDIEFGFFSGIASLATNVAALPLAFLPGGQGAALTAMTLPVAGGEFGEARDKGLGPLAAVTYGASQGAIEYATERLPLARLIGDVKVGTPFFKTLAKQALLEVPGEQVATVLQDLNEWAALNPDKPFSTYLEERPSAAAQTLVATLVGVGGQVTVAKSIEGMVGRITQQAEQANQAERNVQAFGELDKLAAASKVRGRDVASFEAFVAQATEDAPLQDVYIDANVLNQSGVLEALAEVSPSVREQFTAALQTGSDIRIPVAEYTARIAGTELNQGLLDHLKVEPGGFSRIEAQEYMQNQAAALEEEVQRVVEQQEQADQFRAGIDEVKSTVKTQLDQVGRFTGNVNDSYATLMGNFFGVMGAKLGVSPQELYARYTPRFQAQAVTDGQVLDQDAASVFDWSNPGGSGTAEQSARDTKVGDTTISYGVGADNTAEIISVRTPQSKRKQGSARQAIEKFLVQADARGLSVKLQASPLDKKTRLDKLVKFYQSLGFELTGRKINAAGDPEMVRPAKQLNQNKNGARGSFNPATNTITMLKNADLSTFLHESGHFFLEVQFDIAARLQQEAAAFGAETNKPGEQQLLQDTNAVLQWFGLRDLAEWNSLDFEEKRSYHEHFARGFEAYLFEGQAPSIEMQKVFQTFRSWLTNVYRNIVEQAKRMLGKNASDKDAIGKALDVELSPEVRAVFDRMLATEDQIQLAEQGRSMLPLFDSADQAGMTMDEFAAYQSLGKEATDDAIEDVQARTLRDLQWSRNARGREIKRLQKDAAEARREVQMEVRREVMSQPLYRAWTFLTGKMGQGDKIAPMQARKSDPNVLDESQDSLFTAIAKLGGLNKEEVLGTWGSDPADKPSSGVFGKPVWRKEGGRSIDDMAQALGEAGYLSLDENGKVELAEFEGRFDAEIRGSLQFSANYVPEMDFARTGDQVINPAALGAGRIDLNALGDLDLPNEIVERIQSLKMTGKTGLHPDMVAEMFGFTSGDELVRALAMANTPSTEVEGLTDSRMLERFGELATSEAIERAADIAIHNDARARFVATEANALAKAVGQPKILAKAARDFASAMIARLKVRDIRPGQYANAEARAAKASTKASQAGDLVKAAAEKRNQLVNTYAARAAYNAQDEIERGVRYLKKFETDGTRKALDVEYLDQIDALLDRFDLRKGQSLRAIDKRTSLAEWIASQREQGMEPDISPALENEALRKSYKDLTVEEFRGLIDTVKQIDHLGRLKNRLLTAADNKAFNEVRDLLVESINQNAGDRVADTRTPITKLGRAITQVKRFWSAHIKAATWARVMDGGKDGGPVWEYFIRAANERGNMETQMRSDATEALTKILAPVFKQGKMGGKGQFFSSIGRSLNREARLAIALNTGNEGNLQRLLGGEGWTETQLLPVLRSLSQEEWTAVQAIWDHFETYRPQIAAKERRVYGKEPNWVEPGSVVIQEFGIKGGYYPIKYDPLASQQAEQYDDAEAAKRQLQGAFTSATTRRSFTKTRAEEVSGRPLLYSLAGVYSGVNDVIHDLSWHEWLIDTNRLLRSKSIDTAIRTKYGPEVKQQFKQWANDIAEGDKGAQNAGEAFLSRLRQGVSASGLGFNLMSAAIQITGFNQSIVRVGPRWIGRGIGQYIANPIGAARDVVAKSPFMADRARTQFRELNELRNKVEGENLVLSTIQQKSYWLMMRVQKMVDVPTWIGGYEKAISEGNDDDRAIALADQAVIDSQGSGLTKDLSGIERGSQVQKLFTVYYAYMNTAFNLGVAQTMTSKNKAKLAVDYLMIFTVPAVLGGMLKDALTPGGEDEEDMEELARKLAAEQLSYLMGTMFGVREFANASKIVTGAEGGFRDYDGPAGLRAITEVYGFTTQASQGEFDDSFRKSAVNLVGSLFGLPAAQINRSITGTQAYIEGETDNPAAVLFGYQK